jgi:NAD(P)-dependent dehydrogenase (short-subunit alcohol dehydrogenase family)
MDTQRLADKIAVITGGAQGIGRAIASRYAAEGCKVVIADIAGHQARVTASEIGGGAIGVEVDVTKQESIDGLFKQTLDSFGPVDILVNNAAVFEMAPILEITRAQYLKVFAVNVEGLLFTLQSAARQMVEHGARGKIINIASQAGRRGEALVGVYCASKAAVISITQSAGLGLIKHRINVNGIAPGVVDTPMWDTVDAQFAKYEGLQIGEKKKAVGLSVPYGRMGRPDDLVGAAVFLASSDADYVVAQTLNVDGGNWMS